MKLTLFGGPSISIDGKVLPISPFQGALLGVLAAHGQRGARRGELLTLLWDDGDEPALRRRLTQLIYSLHHRLNGARPIHLTGDIYTLDEEVVASDLGRFLVCLSERRVREATSIAARGFLAGLESTPGATFERWVEARDFRFRSDVRNLALEQWNRAEQCSDWAMAEEASEAILRLDPNDEGALRKLMEARALAGRVHEASAAYAEFIELARIDDPEYEPEESTAQLAIRLDELKPANLDPVSGQSYRTGSRPLPFVGRAEELARLSQAMRSSGNDGLRTLHVSGEAGIGKTRLVQEAFARAPFNGIRTLSGKCSEFEMNIPLSPLLDAFSSSWVSAAMQELDDPWRSILSHLLPEHGDAEVPSRGDVPVPPEDIPRVTCDAFLRLLEVLCEAGPLVVFLDDLQWIDATSLSVLSYLRERWRRGGLFFIFAIRADAASRESDIGRWLVTDGGWICYPPLELAPLSQDDTVKLLNEAVPALRPNEEEEWTLPSDVADAIAAIADGRPLLALECLQTFVAAGNERPLATGTIDIPSSVSEMVSDRLAQLSDSGRRLVQILAASDKPLAASLLESILITLRLDLVAEVIDEVVARQLVVVSPKGIDFRHGLLRSAVYQLTSVGERVHAHRAIADAMAAQSNPSLSMDVALHLLAAGDPLRAMPHAREAARGAIETGGWAEARRLLEVVISTDPPPLERAEMCAVLGRLLIFTGEFEEADSRWKEAEENYQKAGNGEGALECQLGSIEARRNQVGMDQDVLLSELRELRADASDRGFRRLVADCFNVEARMLDGMRRIDEVREVTTGVRSIANTGDVDEHVQLLLVSAIDAVYGDPEGAERFADQAAEIARRNDRSDLMFKALNWKIISYYHQALLSTEQGAAVLRETASLSEKSTDFVQRFLFESNVGSWHVEAGDFSAAGRAFRRAESIVDALPVPRFRRNLMINQGQLALELEDYDLARRLFSNSFDVAPYTTTEPFFGFATAGLGLTHLRNGEIELAKDVFRRLPEKPPLWTFDPFLWLALEAGVGAITIPKERVLAEMRREEEILRRIVPTAWMRLRLLRFKMMQRGGLHIPAKEIEELSLFLEDRNLHFRRDELGRILARYSWGRRRRSHPRTDSA